MFKAMLILVSATSAAVAIVGQNEINKIKEMSQQNETKISFTSPASTPTPMPTPVVKLVEPPVEKTILQTKHIAQTFNNCGPATLSMSLSYFGMNISQSELGARMRPYQNNKGDNDDKSVSLDEFVTQAENLGLTAYHRPNGNMKLIKQFVANDIPVVVRTWLNLGEDIGHYRIVRGYSDIASETIQDDSYFGPNIHIPYSDFEQMWQAFNYEYFVLATPNKKPVLEAILKEEVNEKTAWQNALLRAQQQLQDDPQNPYPTFNLSRASYYLGNYQASVDYFESVQSKIPGRMLWYQIEPIMAYQKLQRSDKVFLLTNNILGNHNRAFSELYLLRGKTHLVLGNKDAAKHEFELALFYNKNFTEAKVELAKI